MLAAVRLDDLGDDTFGEDLTTRELEEMIAQRLGKEAALFVLSGTMANLIALLVHCRPGDEVFLDSDAHVLRNEAGGISAIAGVVPTVLLAERGHVDPQALDDAIRPAAVLRPRARLVWLENTHNRGGGSILRRSRQADIVAVAASHGLAVHIDGARLFNAAMAQASSVADLAAGADSVMIDFTKGLSCGAGAAIAGTASFIDAARRWRRTLGGGMRQSGVIASACLVALQTMVERLAVDHKTAAVLAQGLTEVPGLRVNASAVETNIVFAEAGEWGGAERAAATLRAVGVLVSTAPPGHIRLVTHRGIDERAVLEALARIQRASASISSGAA